MKSGDAEFSVGIAYYAMFYTAQAMLNEEELRFRKHAGVHSAFAERFVKSGLMDKKYHRWLLSAFSKRITGDYGIEGANAGRCESFDWASAGVSDNNENVS